MFPNGRAALWCIIFGLRKFIIFAFKIILLSKLAFGLQTLDASGRDGSHGKIVKSLLALRRVLCTIKGPLESFFSSFAN